MPQAPVGTRPLVAPEFGPLLDNIPAFPMTAETLPMVREAIADMSLIPLSEELQSVSTQEEFIDGSDGRKLRLVLFRPAGGHTAGGGAILHIHGGAFIVGTPEMETALARRYAIDLDCLVVSVDYRLAPEAIYPAAVLDCHAALAWMHANAERLSIDPRAIAIAGTSAGGGHAAALALYARDKAPLPICLQVLDQPMLDDRTGSAFDPAPHPYCGEFGHTPASNRFGWESLLGQEPGSPQVESTAVPARVADLTGLPPSFLSVGTLDLFAEETLEYARRLIRAGVPCELHVFAGGYHGWEMAESAPQTQSLRHLRKDALQRAFTSARSST